MEKEYDTVFVRVNRGGEYKDICFSALTSSERQAFMNTLDREGLERLCNILANRIIEIVEEK